MTTHPVQSSPPSLAWHVEGWHELPAVQRHARRFLAGMGFDSSQQWSVIIALTEAATNAIKFAGGGHIMLRRSDNGPPHVVLEVVDDGPGIADPEAAVEDFFSEGGDWRAGPFVTGRRGNGTGLGSIRRMMDVVRLENRTEGGLRLVARKYLSPDAPMNGKETR